MKFRAAILAFLIVFPGISAVAEETPLSKLTALPHADVAKLLGSWQVEGFPAGKMVYEFQANRMAMHGSNPSAGVSFELSMDADYRDAGKDAIWVIATNPMPPLEGADAASAKPSISGVQLVGADRALLSVSADEQFTLVRVH